MYQVRMTFESAMKGDPMESHGIDVPWRVVSKFGVVIPT